MQLKDDKGKTIQVKNEFMERKQSWGGTKTGTGDKARIMYETINGERFGLKLGK